MENTFEMSTGADDFLKLFATLACGSYTVA